MDPTVPVPADDDARARWIAEQLEDAPELTPEQGRRVGAILFGEADCE